MDETWSDGLICEAAALDAALTEPFHAPIAALLAYWRARAIEGVMPRSALRPEELGPLLPNLFLTDRLPPAGTAGPGSGDAPSGFDLVFRLVGTEIARFEGEITRRRLSALIPPAVDPELWRHYGRALAGEVCLRRQTLEWQQRAHVRYEVLLLPLRRGTAGIDALLGIALYRPLDAATDAVLQGEGPFR